MLFCILWVWCFDVAFWCFVLVADLVGFGYLLWLLLPLLCVFVFVVPILRVCCVAGSFWVVCFWVLLVCLDIACHFIVLRFRCDLGFVFVEYLVSGCFDVSGYGVVIFVVCCTAQGVLLILGFGFADFGCLVFFGFVCFGCFVGIVLFVGFGCYLDIWCFRFGVF